MKEKLSTDNLDNILDDAFSAFPDIDLPASFTDDLVRQVENRLTWRLLFTEFGLKIAIAVGSLGVVVMALLLLIINGRGTYFGLLQGNWQLVAAITAIIFFTFLFDQVFLRYLFHRSHHRATT